MQLDRSEMDAVVSRLKRAQGQIGGVLAMIDDGRECREVVTQMAAVSKAVDRAGFAIIAQAMRQAAADPDAEIDVAAVEKMFLSLA